MSEEAIITVHSGESRSIEWNPATHEEFWQVSPDDKIILSVVPTGSVAKPNDQQTSEWWEAVSELVSYARLANPNAQKIMILAEKIVQDKRNQQRPARG